MTKEIGADLHEQIERQQWWAAMTPAQKKKQLFLNQKELLDKFLARRAISRAQYDKSLGDLQEKMGFTACSPRYGWLQNVPTREGWGPRRLA